MTAGMCCYTKHAKRQLAALLLLCATRHHRCSKHALLCVLQELYSESTKSLEREGQLLADRANELLKHIARQRSLSPNIADA